MKIAKITPVFPPYKGGIGMVCYQNTLCATEAGHEVNVYTPLYPSVRKKAARHKHVHTIGIHRLWPVVSYGNAAFVPQLFWKLSHHDLIHLHYPFLGAEFAVILAKLFFRRIPLVVTYHMDLVGKGVFRRIFSMYQKIVPPLLFAVADRILVSSRDYASNSRVRALFGKYSDKITELHNSVNTAYFCPGERREEILGRHSIRPDEKIVMFVGGLDSAHYFKGVDVLLEAFYRLRGKGQRARLVIVGEGNLRPYYEERARDLGLAYSVVFAGLVTNDMLPHYYNCADVVVLPSIDASEAFGVVLLEAMACGKPVIASDLPGPRSVVQDGMTGYVARCGDPADVADKLHRILQDEDAAKRMGATGRKLVETVYSNDVIGRKLQSTYEDLCRQ